MTRTRGLRRDAPILLPASLLLLAMLTSVTLLSYRAAIARFAAEREQAALRLGIGLAEAVRLSKSDEIGVLARWLPPGAGMAIYDGRGGVRSTVGSAGAEIAASPAPRAAGLASPHVVGFGQRTGDDRANDPAAERLRAFVPFERAGQRFLLRLEVPEPALLAQQRSLRVLTPVVFGLSAAVALLAILFLRALVRPYEELLEKARAIAPAGAPPTAREPATGRRDDVEFLLATFDRALAALRTESGQSAASDDLFAVERTLGPQLESGLLMFDRDGRLLAANPAALELLGAGPAAAGQSTAVLAETALARHAGLATVLSAAIADRRSIPRASVAIERAGHRVELGLTLQALRREGTPEPAAGAAGPESDPSPASLADLAGLATLATPATAAGAAGAAGVAATGARTVAGAGFLVLFADVTDLSRREAEERFAAGLAQLGELSAGVAHELRNSLATVQGYLGLAARRELPQAAREEIAEARREAGELARIVDDFLTFARPGSGVLEPVGLAALLARAASDPALAGVAVELATRDPAVPAIAGDPHLLQRALRNLLLNAAQATLAHADDREAGVPVSAREPIVVTLSRDGASAVITIDDRGGGLAPEIRDRLFEPFASGRAGGAGLGLALARRIVVMHGGSLALLPRQPHGVRAEIRLPLDDSATKSST